MEKEIKFKAWDKEEKRWIDIEHLWRNPKGIIETIIDNNGNHYNILQSDSIPFMQYTGLKDKRGIEIYEGDIVKYNAPQEVGKVVEVLFPDDYNWLKECCGGLKIIGNIYENPELLNNN